FFFLFIAPCVLNLTYHNETYLLDKPVPSPYQNKVKLPAVRVLHPHCWLVEPIGHLRFDYH
ncbi:hypothetical protein, partial [Caldibacillus thermoamylovorans]|uniref:hypothetical protein n=1 Tax=Caldibacillus thermoamylovorans TaxID=35841 RepID=UPI001F1BF29E